MFIGGVVFIIVINAGNPVFTVLTIRAVDTSSAGFRLDNRRGFAVCAILALRTNEADGAICTIFAIMAEDNVIYAAIECIMDSRIDRAARDKLLRAVLIRVLCIRICNLTSTDSGAPSVFVLDLRLFRCLLIQDLRLIIVSLIDFDIVTDIGCIDIGFRVQFTLDIR